MAGAGAELAFTYQGKPFGSRLKRAEASGLTLWSMSDWTDDVSLDAALTNWAARWPTIDFSSTPSRFPTSRADGAVS